MSITPKVTWIGFRTLKEAQRCVSQLTDDYMIAVISEGTFDGKVLGYVVVRKDVDPIGGPR